MSEEKKKPWNWIFSVSMLSFWAVVDFSEFWQIYAVQYMGSMCHVYMTCAAGQHGVQIYVCACTGMYMCVSVFAVTYTLQVPMQPTGLSGRPLNPSFLLMAKKRYACRKTHTHTHTHIDTLTNTLSVNTTFTNTHAHDLNASLSVVRVFSDISLRSYQYRFEIKKYPIWFEMSFSTMPFHIVMKVQVHHLAVPLRHYCCCKS